jgi:O-antigen/teichoic acid export membrane protein
MTAAIGKLSALTDKLGQIDPKRLLKPFDTATETGRSKERYRRAFLTTLGSAVTRVIGVGTSLITVPLTLKYLGVERYGLWMTIASLIAFLGFSDLGIGNGLLNGISNANGRDDRILARQYVSSALFLLSAVAAVLGLAFFVAYPFIPWNAIFHVKSPQAIAEAGPAVAAFLACFLIGFPGSIINKIQSGYQEGFVSNIWSIVGSLMGLAAGLIVIRIHGSLSYLVLALSGTPILMLFTNGLFLFGYQRPWLRPAWSQVRRGVSRELFHTGLLFLVLQIAVAVAFSADNLVLAHVLGPEAVTRYAIPCKLFGLIGFATTIIVGPLWPAYTEALARCDHRWIRKTMKRSLLSLLALSLGASALLVAFAPSIIRLWVGQSVQPPFLVLMALGIWSVINALSAPASILLNAATVIKFQVVVASVTATANIVLSVYLTKRIGISGVVFGSIFSQVFLALIPYYLYTYYFMNSVATASKTRIGSLLDRLR